MRLLLDTCVFLWACTEPERLSERAIEALETAGHEIWVSAASTWEIAVKHQLGKLPLPRPPDQLIPDLRDRLGATSLPSRRPTPST